MAAAGRRLIPLLDRILVERFAPEVKSKGGILLPEQSQNKVQTATVVAVGDGGYSKDGQRIPVSVKAGDKVVLPEYGGQKIEVDKKELFIFRDSDILAKWQD
ncbi:10 kDa heat shock protein, mitochondrial isoform X2 [Galendromus occidentalis]|nr:10 kDa heat shock protein, mitochondrial isoform X2 [Galendromus occidentalis]